MTRPDPRPYLILFLSAASLAACASDGVKYPVQPGRPPPTTQGRVTGALAQPLHDINLVRTKIPDVLLDAMDAPYARPRPLTCLEIVAEIGPLNEALGPDLDLPVSAANPSLLQRGTNAAGDAAIDAIRGAAESVIPMRGWVRRLTGAEQHDRLVAAAITAGGVRRAYLKGLGLEARCDFPALPLPAAQNAIAGAQRLQRAADVEASRRRQ
jgi:hypothetical protein